MPVRGGQTKVAAASYHNRNSPKRWMEAEG